MITSKPRRLITVNFYGLDPEKIFTRKSEVSQVIHVREISDLPVRTEEKCPAERKCVFSRPSTVV